jgi:hypothetical protein
MAKLVTDPKSLPDRAVPIPGAKPPVFSLLDKDLGHPEEVEAFRDLLRKPLHWQYDPQSKRDH